MTIVRATHKASFHTSHQGYHAFVVCILLVQPCYPCTKDYERAICPLALWPFPSAFWLLSSF